MNDMNQTGSVRHLVMIAAVDEALGIGKEGKIPWDCPEDRSFFKAQTMGRPLIVGRVTFEEWGGKPLPGQPCAVWTKNRDFVSQHNDFKEEFTSSDNLNFLLNWCFERNKIVFVCGGQALYEALSDQATDLFLTRIPGNYGCDRFFPDIFNRFQRKAKAGRYEHYIKCEM